jgi:hypothetical protein
LKSGNLNLLEPSGPVQPVIGLLFFLPQQRGGEKEEKATKIGIHE